MKLHLIDRRNATNASFSIKTHRFKHFLKVWHYHPELELVLITKSIGTRFIGDNVAKFQPGDVVLTGANLPHMWVNDDVYFKKESDLLAEAIAIHFKEDFLGTHFFQIPEMRQIAQLFAQAQHGILFKDLDHKIIEKIKKLELLDDFYKTLKLIEILHDLAKHSPIKRLASVGFIHSFRTTENKSLDAIYEFVFRNFSAPIGSKDAAAVAHMNPSAFSRFFKRIHRKTFTTYLNEVRIGYACKLLLEQKLNITSICFESGFNNISNFNRQFKKITKSSPRTYLQQHIEHVSNET
ncbi:AraC family transcriptional regulator [Arenibacter sp. GZD96]|uniref:AraC family transcriptional regulator n=1 Tax=Aurantibrevibacter litoralis TaxID=3106030 RepID=UPI002B0028A2|nr:AraC family transcriptional regulator [Arenibacter sp. GZD-96]MEA1786992.1 AraC family transcriptional regulator [Arenibacter sp. GZD-96]